MSDWLVAIATAVISGLVALVVVKIQTRSQRDAANAARSVEHRRLDIEGLETLVTQLQAQNGRQEERLRLLEAHRKDDEERIDGLEKALHVEERKTQEAVRYIRRLFDWIADHIPGVDPPEVPQLLREVL